VITRRLVTGLLCALSLVGVSATAGCFSDAQGTVEKITLGYGNFPGWLPWKVAEEQGIFDNNGIKVELKYYDNVADSRKAMAGGTLDANNQTLSDTLSELGDGSRPQKVVLVNDTSTGADQIIAREGISGVSGLKGKKVAVQEGPDESVVDFYFLLLALRDANLTLGDVDLRLMHSDAATDAFLGGKVDAVVNRAPFTSKALSKKGSRALATTAEYPSACSDHLVVSENMTKNRPDEVQALVNSWFQTLNWIKGHKDEANEVLAKQAGVDAADYDSYAAGLTMLTLQQNIDSFTPGVTAKNLNYQANDIADFLTGAGLAKKRPSVDDLLDGRFVKAAA
jgi:NitT/TauT family transport system substrate-binding protein